MVSLTDNDVKILKFIKRHQPVSIKDIERAMPEVSAIQYRVEELATYECRSCGGLSIAIDNTSYIEEDYEDVKDEATGFTNAKPLGIYIGSLNLEKKHFKITNMRHHCTVRNSGLKMRGFQFLQRWLPT